MLLNKIKTARTKPNTAHRDMSDYSLNSLFPSAMYSVCINNKKPFSPVNKNIELVI